MSRCKGAAGCLHNSTYGKTPRICRCQEENKLYVKDGVALYVTGMGKVNSALSLNAILLDERFDFSNAYIFSTGCAGSAYEYGVMGDVWVYPELCVNVKTA